VNVVKVMKHPVPRHTGSFSRSETLSFCHKDSDEVLVIELVRTRKQEAFRHETFSDLVVLHAYIIV
jgi:hypothetical protein